MVRMQKNSLTQVSWLWVGPMTSHGYTVCPSLVSCTDDIAVDWISNKLYWVDAVWARIEVLDLESYYRAEVLRVGPSTLPRAIAVDPISRSI